MGKLKYNNEEVAILNVLNLRDEIGYNSTFLEKNYDVYTIRELRKRKYIKHRSPGIYKITHSGKVRFDNLINQNNDIN